MNGFDFNLRVLQPWARDPAFYATVWTEQSDTPAHEGPTAHGSVELWTYSFPLSPQDEARLAGELRPIPAFLAQARENLTGNARDLWTTGIGTMRDQVGDLADLAAAGRHRRRGASRRRRGGARRRPQRSSPGSRRRRRRRPAPPASARRATPGRSSTSTSLPMTWEDEVAILPARAGAGARVAEARRGAQPRPAAADAAARDDAEYQRRADRAIRKFIAFLGERNLYPHARHHGRRRCASAAARTCRSSSATSSPSPCTTSRSPSTPTPPTGGTWRACATSRTRARCGAARSSTTSGTAARRAWRRPWRSCMLHAGLFDDKPRVREIVWIMLAQRAARGLASLYLQANEIRPRRRPRPSRSSGRRAAGCAPTSTCSASSSSSTCASPATARATSPARYQLEDLLRERAHQLGDAFTLKRCVRGGQRRRHHPGLAHPLAAHRGSGTRFRASLPASEGLHRFEPLAAISGGRDTTCAFERHLLSRKTSCRRLPPKSPTGTERSSPMPSRRSMRFAAALALTALLAAGAADQATAQTLAAGLCPGGSPFNLNPTFTQFLAGQPGIPLLRRTIDLGVYPDARCNDGSAAVMYIRPANAAYGGNPIVNVSRKWVIFLDGGGGCRDADECLLTRWCSGGGAVFDRAGKMQPRRARSRRSAASASSPSSRRRRRSTTSPTTTTSSSTIAARTTGSVPRNSPASPPRPARRSTSASRARPSSRPPSRP